MWKIFGSGLLHLGQALAYVYARETRADADTAKVLTMDEARRIASNIARGRFEVIEDDSRLARTQSH